jgi:hypothetical protein
LTDTTNDAQAPSEEDEGLGFFRSWGSLYLSVVIYTAASIAVLYWITVALDFRPS